MILRVSEWRAMNGGGYHKFADWAYQYEMSSLLHKLRMLINQTILYYIHIEQSDEDTSNVMVITF